MTNIAAPGQGVSQGEGLYPIQSGYVIGNTSGSVAEPYPILISSLTFGLTIDSTTITGGTIGNVLYHKAADVLGEMTTTGSGTVVALATSPALLGTPTAPTAAAGTSTTQLSTTAFTTTAVNNAIAGVNPAVAVQAATTGAANTSGFTYNNGVSGVGATFTGSVNTAVTIDGFTFTAVGQRLLVKNDTQSPSGAFNGVYTMTVLQTGIAAPVFTRATDYNAPSDINNTGAIPVVNGTVNALTSWLLTSSVTTVGTDPLTYAQFSYSPTSVIPPALGGTGVANNAASTITISGNFATTFTVPAANNYTLPAASCDIGYLEIPQNSESADYQLVLADSGKHIYHPGADTTARTFTIPANSGGGSPVAFPIGTAVTFINDTLGGVITIAITTDTLVLAGAGTTGSRTLAASGIATAVKMTSTRWIISGTGLT